MPFQRPTLAELVARIEAEVSTRLGIGPLLDRGPLRALSRVFAGTSHGMHGHLDYISRQVVPLLAEAAVLEQWADLYGLERLPASKAGGQVTFSGTNGTAVGLGVLLTRTDGAKFRTTSSGVVAGGTVTLDVLAEVAGAAGNTVATTALALSTPIAGITGAVVAAGGLVGGEDRETDEELRTRLRDTVSARPQGGSVADYKAWALEVGGVTRVWVFPAFQGLGTVGVTFAVDDDPAGPAPSAPQVAAVQARLTDTTRRDSAPVGATVTAFAAVVFPVNFTIELLGADTQAIRDAVAGNLADLILREGAPGGTLLLSHVAEAISTAPGEVDHVLTVPAGDLTFTTGQLPTLGTITWV